MTRLHRNTTVNTDVYKRQPYIRYISNISDAVQSISEGNLNTTIDVIGDDEFSSMAANLNTVSYTHLDVYKRQGMMKTKK